MNFEDIKRLNDILKSANQEAVPLSSNRATQNKACRIAKRVKASFDSSSSVSDSESTLHDDVTEIIDINECFSKNVSLPEPKYQIYYKKMLSTEDIFFDDQSNIKASSDCSHLVIKVHFGLNTRLNDLSLSVKSNHICVETRER